MYRTSMTQRVPFPKFELVGPPCLDTSCKGVLVDHLDLLSKDFYRQCSVCKTRSGRMPAKDKLKEVVETIERVAMGDFKTSGLTVYEHLDGYGRCPYCGVIPGHKHEQPPSPIPALERAVLIATMKRRRAEQVGRLDQESKAMCMLRLGVLDEEEDAACDALQAALAAKESETP